MINNINNIKDIVHTLHTINSRELFIALLINDTIDYLDELEDLTEDDIDVLNKVYDRYIETDTIYSLINPDVIELIETILEERKEDKNEIR